VLAHLSWVEGVVRKAQHVGVVLLLPDEELPEVDGAGNGRRIAVVNTHSVEVAEVCDSPHILDFGSISEEAHTLKPTIPEHLVDSNGDLIGEKTIEDGSENVHASVLPEATFVKENFMAHYVGNCGQLGVGTCFVEPNEVHYEVVREREVLPGDVLFTPKF
jgi:hypothetical protein